MPLPLIAWAIIAGGAAVTGAAATAAKTYGEFQRGHGLIYTAAQDWGLAPPVDRPTAPPAPPAPRDRQEMTSPAAWTPAVAAERERESFRTWAREGAFTPATPPPPRNPDSQDVYILAAIGAAAAALLLMPKGAR